MAILRTASLVMTNDYPGDRLQEVSGYSEMRIQDKFILFIIPETNNVKHIYFKRKYIIEIETNRGRVDVS